MDDDLQVDAISRVRAVDRRGVISQAAIERLHRREREEQRRRKRRESFGEDFAKRFGLNPDEYAINLIKLNDRWVVEIMNRKTRKRIYQDYETICNILDIRKEMPKIVGVNVDMKV